MHSNNRFSPSHTGLGRTPISDFWQISPTGQDPEVPNLPLETFASGSTGTASGGVPIFMLAVAALPVLMPTPGRGGEDELPIQAATVVEDEGAFVAARVIPGWTCLGLHQYQYDQPERAPSLQEDGGYAPRVRTGPTLSIQVQRPGSGFSTTALLSLAADEGEQAQAPPLVAPVVTASPWLGQPDELAPVASFVGTEDVGPLYAFTGPAYRVQLPPTGGYSTDVATFGLNDESEYQVTVPLWPVPVVLPQTFYQPDERVTPPTPIGVDEGEYAPVPPPVWVAVRPFPWDGLPDENVPQPSAFGLDESTGPIFQYVGPRYRVQFPPTGGYSTPGAPTFDEGEYQPTPPPVWVPVVLPPAFYQVDELVDQPAPFYLDEDGFIVAPLAPFGEPVLYLDATEATPWLWQEDIPGPLPVPPWGARVPNPWIWEQDQVGTPAAPLANDEGTFTVPLPPVWRPVVLPPAQGNDEHPLFIFVEDYGWSPRVGLGSKLSVFIHRPAGGYSTERVVVDEGEWPAPPPWPVPVRVAPVWLNEDRVEPPPAFYLVEDLDADLLHRALPPVWRTQRTPIAFWDVDEARVPPATASGARGTGRTHLFLGQVSNDPTPQSAGAELYVLTGGYGTAAGDDTALLIETPDIAPLGPAGRMRLRRLALPLQYDAACTVRITPIVDYMTELAPTLVTLAAPGRVTRAMLQAKYLTACTTIRLRLEVVSRNGPVELYRPSVFFSPLSGGTTMTMGGQP